MAITRFRSGQRLTAAQLNAIVDRMNEHDRMGFSLARVAAQTLPDAAFTAVSWDTETVDTTSTFTPAAAGATVITIPADGIWAITASMTAVVAPTGLAMISPRINGAEFGRQPFADNIASSTIVFSLLAGAAVEIQMYRDGAAATTMTGYVQIYRIAL